MVTAEEEEGRPCSEQGGGWVSAQDLSAVWAMLHFISQMVRTRVFAFQNNVLEFIGVTLVSKIIQVSGVRFYHTSSVYCTVCSPPQVKSPSITIHPHFALYLHPHPALLFVALGLS